MGAAIVPPDSHITAKWEPRKRDAKPRKGAETQKKGWKPRKRAGKFLNDLLPDFSLQSYAK